MKLTSIKKGAEAPMLYKYQLYCWRVALQQSPFHLQADGCILRICCRKITNYF